MTLTLTPDLEGTMYRVAMGREKNENGPDHVKKEEEEGKGRIHKRLRQVKCLTHTSTRIRISVFEVVLDCKKTFLENAENLDQNIKKCRNGLGNKRRGKGLRNPFPRRLF